MAVEHAQTPEERDTERIEELSPEGRPAEPEFRTAGFAVLIFVSAGVLLVVAALVGMLVHPLAGVMIAGFGLVVLACNPALWAAGLRAKEREHFRRGELK